MSIGNPARKAHPIEAAEVDYFSFLRYLIILIQFILSIFVDREHNY